MLLLDNRKSSMGICASREFMGIKENVDQATVNGFGEEWSKFDQSELPERELVELFESYFSIFPWDKLPENAEGFDVGCGSGRWAKLVAPRVGRLHCIEPSAALEVARKNLIQFHNCTFHRAIVNAMPIEDAGMDFGYSLGVLHHIPDTQAAIDACVNKLKTGAPFLVYLYYALNNRPSWYKIVWRASDVLRRLISASPHKIKYIASQIIAALVYLPLARLSAIMEKIGFNVSNIPLSNYRNRSFYTMRTDALDRFGTKLEQRFSRDQIKAMMEKAGLERIRFSPVEPFWCAVGYRCSKDNSKNI